MKRMLQPFGNATVQLRLITEADLDLTMGWRNRDDVRGWFKNSQIITTDQHRTWFAKYVERDDDFVFIVEALGRPVGQASVYGIEWEKRSAEVGRFVAAPEAGGRGYIGLACGELLQFCRTNLNLNFVLLEVKEDNERAIRLYARNGFREQGRAHGLIRMTLSLDQSVEGGLCRQASNS
jgi:diamine N-acetyltransferase